MNIKTLLLVPGAIALSLSCISMVPALAQVNDSVAPVQLQRGMNKLNLTDAQKAQLKQLREETKAQIQQILTPDQRAKMQSFQSNRQPGQQPGNGKKWGGHWKELNLTDAQKQQIRQIRENAKQKMQAILTPEQRAMLQQNRQERQQKWQQRRQQSSGQSQ